MVSPVSSNNCFNVLSSISFEDINFKIKMSASPFQQFYYDIYIFNIIKEFFFRIMKHEMLYGHESEFKTFGKFKKAVAVYIDHCNNQGIKSKSKWMPPSKFREASMLDL